MGVIERRFCLNELELAALEWSGEGIPVIALHGWLDNAASFSPLAPYLQGAYLLAPDLVGHGRSSHLPAAANYHLSDTCRWVVALADAMGWQRFVLLGHSMGAAAACITAAAVPHRVAGLVLLDGLGPLAFTPQQEVRRLQRLFAGGDEKKSGRAFPSLESAVKVRQRLGRFPISSEAARLLSERGMVEVVEGYRWSHDERLTAPSTHYYSAEQAEGILRTIEAATLLITATDGAFKEWQGFSQRMQCVARLEHVTLAGGHHLHMEQPEAVADIINPYLSGLEGYNR